MLSNHRPPQAEKNYQNRSFRGQNLSYQDFSNADIRGANFTAANLTGANFRRAKAGLPQRAMLRSIVIAAALSGFSGAAAVMAVNPLISSITPKLRASFPLTIGFIIFLVLICVNAILLSLTLRQGLQEAIKKLGIAIAILIPIFGILAALGSDNHPIFYELRGFRIASLIGVSQTGSLVPSFLVSSTITIGATLTVIFTLTFAIALIKIVSNQILENLIVIEALAIATIASGIVSKNADERVFEFFNPALDSSKSNFEAIITLAGLVILSILLSATLILIGRKLGQTVLDDRSKDPIIRQFAINLGSWGGTRFIKANLTDTNFNQTLLKSTDFSDADTHHTRWYEAQKLEWAKVEGTILTDPKVRQLLVSLKGDHQSYIGANLQGANLMNAHLEYSNWREANLSEATLENANLEWANLSQTQAINTNFREARLTGASGLSTWNIDSTTNLLWVNCKFIYLLEEAKPGTDDRERRPSSGEFKADEFSKLFQEALNTVDLIFREGIDWRGFIYSFKKVQVQNQETELKIQRIEDKGDGVFIVRVQVPPEADKAKIHQDFTQNYDQAIKTLESQYQDRLKIQESELLNYRQLNSNMMEVVRFLASREIIQEPRFFKKNKNRLGKLVIVKIIQGDFMTGFTIAVQIGQDGMLPSTEISAFLPACPELKINYEQWKSLYTQLQTTQRISARKINLASNKKSCKESAITLEKQLKTWLNSEEFYLVKDRIQQKINPQDETRFIIQTENSILLRLPWHVWNLFDHYPKAEVGLTLPQYDQAEPITSTLPKKRVRILAILGNSDQGINVQKDRAILQQIVGADVTVLEEPKRAEVDVHLWDEMGWDILFFAGHSMTQEESGVIYINPNECLTVPDLKYALRFAVQGGLKLAIFNSCDGLGLARDLADLQIPQIIVMREPVPDLIATEFLKSFLSAFSRGKTLYTAVREAREKLHAQEDQYPCASWLPVIFQNPAEVPLMWDNLRGLSTSETELKPFLEILAKLRELFEQNTDLSPLDQANVLEQIQSLVQIAQMPPSEIKQRLGSKALMVIKGTLSDLPVTSTLKQQCQLLLTKISQEILG